MKKQHRDDKYTLILPVLFGNERALSNELLRLGFSKEAFSLIDGRALVQVSGEEMPRALALLNLSSRIAERVLIQLGAATVKDFDQLFEAVRKLPWHRYLNKGAAFTVSGYSRNSVLTSVPACQRVIKKAIVLSLLSELGKSEDATLAEDPALGEHEIQFSLLNDELTLMMDTSGEPLHKRSYRKRSHLAPLRETTSASLLEYSYIRNVLLHGGVVIDLFTGSGTLIIEAAMIALDLAPGRLRTFAAEQFDFVGAQAFKEQRQVLKKREAIIEQDDTSRFIALDIDSHSIKQAQANARSAQVADRIKFIETDSTKLDFSEILELAGGREILLLGNPPYGERMEDEEKAREIAVRLGERLAYPLRAQKHRVSLSLITAEEHFEKDFGLKAKKKRKLYNGSIACTLYNYY